MFPSLRTHAGKKEFVNLGMELLPIHHIHSDGELPFQMALPKEQRSNLHFEGAKTGPSFEETQKKMTKHKKITKPVGGGSSFIFG